MMKKTKRICSFATLVASLMFVAIVAQTGRAVPVVQVPFYDSFDKYELDGNKHQPPWQTLFDGKSAEVSNHTENFWPRSDGQSLRLEGYPCWARMEYVKLDSLPDILNYEATVHLEQVGNSIKVGFMWVDCCYPNQGPMADCFNFSPQNDQMGIISWSGKDDNTVILGEYQVGGVYHLRAEINAISETADVYAFDVISGDWWNALDVPAWGHTIPCDCPPYTVVLDQFGIAAGGMCVGTANSIVYVDDVLITPEPGTILLLGLGGLVLRRRHSK
jgi:hypothetical protein